MCKEAALRTLLLLFSFTSSLVWSSDTSVGLAAMHNEALPVFTGGLRGGASIHSYTTPDHHDPRAFTISDAGAASTAAGFNSLDDKPEGMWTHGDVVNTTTIGSAGGAESFSQHRDLQLTLAEDFVSTFQTGTRFNDTTLRGVNGYIPPGKPCPPGVSVAAVPAPAAAAAPSPAAAGGAAPGIAGGVGGAPGGVVPNPVGGTSVSGINVGLGAGQLPVGGAFRP